MMEVKTARRTKVDPAMMADSHFSIRPMNDGYCQTTRHYYHHGSHPTNNDSEISRNDDVYDYRYSRTAKSDRQKTVPLRTKNEKTVRIVR